MLYQVKGKEWTVPRIVPARNIPVGSSIQMVFPGYSSEWVCVMSVLTLCGVTTLTVALRNRGGYEVEIPAHALIAVLGPTHPIVSAPKAPTAPRGRRKPRRNGKALLRSQKD